MDITYLGHSSFRIKASGATVVTDPYDKSVGFSFPRVSADVVTVSHGHDDHSNYSVVTGTTRRVKPFIVDAPGEYEVGGVSVFGVATFHDSEKGEKRGANVVYSIIMDGLAIAHLGDLGHELTESQIAELNGIDVLMCPVGGVYTIGAKEASEIVSKVEPSIFIPMHYRTAKHDQSKFGSLSDVEGFIKEFGGEYKKMDKLTVTKTSLPEEMEIVVLEVS